MTGKLNDLPYFFYGTLRDPDVFHRVCRVPLSDFDVEPSILFDCRPVYVEGQLFPGLIKDPQAQVEGIVVSGLCQSTQQHIHDFEDPEDYLLKTFQVEEVQTSKQKPVNLFWPQASLLLSARSWDFNVWQVEEKVSYLELLHHWLRD